MMAPGLRFKHLLNRCTAPSWDPRVSFKRNRPEIIQLEVDSFHRYPDQSRISLPADKRRRRQGRAHSMCSADLLHKDLLRRQLLLLSL